MGHKRSLSMPPNEEPQKIRCYRCEQSFIVEDLVKHFLHCDKARIKVAPILPPLAEVRKIEEEKAHAHLFNIYGYYKRIGLTLGSWFCACGMRVGEEKNSHSMIKDGSQIGSGRNTDTRVIKTDSAVIVHKVISDAKPVSSAPPPAPVVSGPYAESIHSKQ